MESFIKGNKAIHWIEFNEIKQGEKIKKSENLKRNLIVLKFICNFNFKDLFIKFLIGTTLFGTNLFWLTSYDCIRSPFVESSEC